ncbi:hypothetical protein SNE40_008241 [Patella caerulea]|uniref:Peptidase S1 domain-containing protein n=1 Tax=Patella caerulea TaxID=87958 RepID=A0AAN8Q3H1_PATCE
MLLDIGILLVTLLGSANAVHGYSPLYRACSYNRCIYYAQIVQQSTSSSQTAAYLYQRCRCSAYGVPLYTRPSTQTTSTPVNNQASTIPVSPSQCGTSSITGSAATYLSNQRERIVGGVNTQECEFPWAVLVTADGSQCGGSIIDSTHIVTAAHCMVNGNSIKQASSVRVGAGSSNRNNLRYYNVRTVSVHPSYNPSTFENDAAVLTLQSPLPTNNPCIKPICLPSTRLNVQTGTKCTVAGWGLTQEFSGFAPSALQEATVPIFNKDTCRQAYGSNIITDVKICAGFQNGGIDACKGDSGGPLMCAEGDNWVLTGIVSFGNGCAVPNYPGVYAYVPNLKNWIESITNGIGK